MQRLDDQLGAAALGTRSRGVQRRRARGLPVEGRDTSTLVPRPVAAMRLLASSPPRSGVRRSITTKSAPAARHGDALVAVAGLADDHEAGVLEQGAKRRANGRRVVHDQDPGRHRAAVR
jgi:hypothetical protein